MWYEFGRGSIDSYTFDRRVTDALAKGWLRPWCVPVLNCSKVHTGRESEVLEDWLWKYHSVFLLLATWLFEAVACECVVEGCDEGAGQDPTQSAQKARCRWCCWIRAERVFSAQRYQGLLRPVLVRVRPCVNQKPHETNSSLNYWSLKNLFMLLHYMDRP